MIYTPGSQLCKPEGVRAANPQGTQPNYQGTWPKLISLKAVLLSGLEILSQKSTGPWPGEAQICEELGWVFLHLTASEHGATVTSAGHISGNKQCCSGAVTVPAHEWITYAEKKWTYSIFTSSQLFLQYMIHSLSFKLVTALRQGCS